MTTLPARYAAWCRRQSAMQCNPWAIGGVLVAVAGFVLSRQLHAHWTGIMQAVAGAGAALACLAAAGLVILAMRIVERAPLPATPVTGPEPARQPAVITAMTLRPEERDEMTREADMLASGELDFVVTERRGLFELREDDEARS